MFRETLAAVMQGDSLLSSVPVAKKQKQREQKPKPAILYFPN